MEKTLTLGLTLFLTLCLDIPQAGARKEGAHGENTQKRSSRSPDAKAGRCSYTFIVPQQKLTGALCLNTQSATTNHSEVAALRAELMRQQEQLEKLRGQLEQEGSLAMEVRALNIYWFQFQNATSCLFFSFKKKKKKKQYIITLGSGKL